MRSIPDLSRLKPLAVSRTHSTTYQPCDLAKAANEFLKSLLAGSAPDIQISGSVFDRREDTIGGAVDEGEEHILLETNKWVVEQGLPEGELGYELADKETGEVMAIIDLAWPGGLQEGFSPPVALLIDEDLSVKHNVNRAGYLFFTNAEDFKQYVMANVLATQEAAV